RREAGRDAGDRRDPADAEGGEGLQGDREGADEPRRADPPGPPLVEPHGRPRDHPPGGHRREDLRPGQEAGAGRRAGMSDESKGAVTVYETTPVIGAYRRYRIEVSGQPEHPIPRQMVSKADY